MLIEAVLTEIVRNIRYCTDNLAAASFISHMNFIAGRELRRKDTGEGLLPAGSGKRFREEVGYGYDLFVRRAVHSLNIQSPVLRLRPPLVELDILISNLLRAGFFLSFTVNADTA